MKIVSLLGVLKSQELTITKGISSLIIASNLAIDDFLNEKISVYIERGNGNNVILANKVKIKDFILASTYGGSAIQSDENFSTIAVCELALDGAIYCHNKQAEDLPFDHYRVYIVSKCHKININSVEHHFYTHQYSYSVIATN